MPIQTNALVLIKQLIKHQIGKPIRIKFALNTNNKSIIKANLLRSHIGYAAELYLDCHC